MEKMNKERGTLGTLVRMRKEHRVGNLKLENLMLMPLGCMIPTEYQVLF